MRRRKETFRDLDIIATANDPRALTDHFASSAWVAEVAAHGDTKATVVSHDGLRFDLRVVPPESYGNLLQHFTGSKDHNVALREHAVKRGLSISEYGIKNVETGEVFTTRDEAELYEFLGYQFIPPELRENLGELDAARKGELPELVDVSQVARRPAPALDVVVGRQEHGRGDGAQVHRARLRVPRHHRPLALPARRAARGAVARDRSGEREGRAVPHPPRDRGEHPSRPARSTSTRRRSRSSTGSSRRSTRPSTRTRPSGS